MEQEGMDPRNPWPLGDEDFDGDAVVDDGKKLPSAEAVAKKIKAWSPKRKQPMRLARKELALSLIEERFPSALRNPGARKEVLKMTGKQLRIVENIIDQDFKNREQERLATLNNAEHCMKLLRELRKARKHLEGARKAARRFTLEELHYIASAVGNREWVLEARGDYEGPSPKLERALSPGPGIKDKIGRIIWPATTYAEVPAHG